MSDYRDQCESSFYKELYHVDGKNQRVLLNTVTGRMYLEKTLDTYDLRVFEFLRVNRNPHIPAVESCALRDGKLVVLEDYVNGETLTEYLKRGATEQERLRIFLDVCDALRFLHSANPPIIHRDVKADNILITTDGIVKLADYDAAKVFDPAKNADTVLIGTPGAAAPEQYGFAQSDARTDIYALGVLLRQLLPVGSKYAAVAEKATRMDPKDRYRSVEEIKKALGAPEPRKRIKWFRPFLDAPAWKKTVYIILIALVGLFAVSGTDSSLKLEIENYWLLQIFIVLVFLGWIEIGFDMSGLIRRITSENISRGKRAVLKIVIGIAYLFLMLILNIVLDLII